VATGKSFRTPTLAECCARGGDTFSVEAEVEREGAWDLAVAFADGGRRQSLQGRASSLAEHLALLPVVAWSEAERDLVAGPAAARRRFLDRAALLLKPSRVAEHAELHRAMAQKRHLLAGGGQPSELAAWNELLAPLIARRAHERAELVTRIENAATALLAAHHADLPPLRLEYKASPAEALAGAAATGEALAGAAARERERGQPLLGPQRDRVEVVMDEAAVRRFASAGERKVLALALLGALAELLVQSGKAPLVLLDDLDAELDRSRLRLASALFSGAPQVIVTSSRPELFSGTLAGASWALSEGLSSPG
jgi:DNA replication and repair protein RecF